MITIGRFHRPLNILAVIGDGSSLGPGLMSALSRHYTLICRTWAEARAAAEQFAADIVLMADSAGFGRDRNRNCDAATSLTAVTLDELKSPSHSQCSPCLSLPASYDEAELFLHEAAAKVQRRIELLRTSA